MKKFFNRIISTAKESLIFAKRALIKMCRTPEQLIDITLMPIMFTLVFTFVFGGAIAGNWLDYLPIIIPGILVQTFVTSCGVSASQIREDMDKATTKRFKAMPISRVAPVAGILIADLPRFAVAGTVVFLLGVILGFRAGFFAIVFSILFMMLVGWCLSWLFAWVGLKAKSAGAAQAISMLIMFPLTFFSNALVTSEAMPKPLAFFVDNINPISKAVSAVREMLMFGTLGADFGWAVLGSCVILALFIPMAISAYKKRA